ncbi:MAG: UDP-N-acetylmuramate dehydrogenase [Muribaculaceae bacterium]|nr:UDP-N-acetylmuramate dehydrogenase [Muribaculaceae bacterium]
MSKQYNYSLLGHNTMGIDVKAQQFITYDTVDELKEVLQEIAGRPILHIGRGSNLLFTRDFEGVVLHSSIKFTQIVMRNQREVVVRVGAGVVWDDFCAQMAQNNFYGSENLSHIPGEVGAAAVQNIGAYGVEVESIIQEVETIEIATGKPRVFHVSECEYGYRESIFKNQLRGQYVVTAVVFKLSVTPVVHLDYGQLQDLKALPHTPSAQDIRDAVIAIRRSKLPEPDHLGSAGSFFKNPVVPIELFNDIAATHHEVPHYAIDEKQIKIPAAWLIEQCGWKGKCHGGAAVYEKQPLIIVNKNHATSSDIMELASLIQQSVYDTFKINIYPEVNYI